MATKLKIIDETTDIVPAPEPPQFTPAPTRNRHAGWTAGQLERELSLVRARGYARDNEELELGVRCMAAGIRDDSGKLIAGLSISAPADRLQEDWVEDLVKTANEISVTLGYVPQQP